MTHAADTETSTIDVTPAAKDAIRQLTETNGELLFHIPGGCCDSRTPVCLPKGDLALGPRDRLIGHADGVPVYEMTDGNPQSTKAYKLFVTDGFTKGFSLSPGDGKTFGFRETGTGNVPSADTPQ